MKKRLYSMGVMLLCSLLSFAQFSGSGSGTENDPYLILNPIQLNQMRNFLNKEGVYFKLMANIDLEEFIEDEFSQEGWQPIGVSSNSFQGILNGNGKTVSGLKIQRGNTSYVGLFGYVTSATIKNLTLKGTIEGSSYVGGFCGYAKSTTLTGCTFDGTVNGTNNVGGFIGYSYSNTLNNNHVLGTVISNGDNVGGFLGYCEYGGGVTNCTSDLTLISGNNNVGGICGNNRGKNHNFENCYVHSAIQGKGDYVGGICGNNENSSYPGDFNHCCFIGTISGNNCVGGIVGQIKRADTSHNDTSILDDCFAIADITALGEYTGGLVGKDLGNYDSWNGSFKDTNISNSYYSGTISGTKHVGGLVGYKYRGSIQKCYATATVIGTMCVGGLCGSIKNTTVKSNAAINNIVNASTSDVGRIYGYDDGGNSIGETGSTSENKALNRTVVLLSGVFQQLNDGAMHGTGVSPTTLKLKATYVTLGWEFGDTWAIQETECYPYKGWQTAPPVITSNLVSKATTISGKSINGGTVYLDYNGTQQQKVATGNQWSFSVSPLQSGREVRVYAKADGLEQSYYNSQKVSYPGKGTASDPYLVYTADDLTGTYNKGYYKLMNDIDLTNWIQENSPVEGWIPVGREGGEMTQFDGNGHKITGLWTNTTKDYTGLFSNFSNGTIKNLTVVIATGKQVKGGNYTGGLIGMNSNGKILNCTVKGKVVGTTLVGGIVGSSTNNELSGNIYSGTIESSGASAHVGGLAGQSQNDVVKGCKADVAITATGGSAHAGGLVGTATSTFSESASTGKVTATGTETYVGGLLGFANQGNSITDCYSTANVTSGYSAAGVVAYNYGSIDKCYGGGDVISSNYGAGIVGYNDGWQATIHRCVAVNNRIDVTFESQSGQGGGYGQRIIGGIKNGAPAPNDELDNLALKTMQVSINNVPQKVYDDIMNGKGMEKTELMQKYAYELLGWDFTNTWDIDTGVGTPFLRNVGKVDSGGTPEVNPDDPVNPEADTDNVLILNNVYAAPGQQIVMPIDMKNSAEITAIQFDLYLPEGATIATDEDGESLIDLGDRTTMRKHSVAYRQQADGAMKIVCSSNSNAVFSGNNGTVLTVTLNVSTDMADGDYALLLKNIELSDNTGTAHNPANVKATLGVSSYMLGDVDGNGTVSINDGVCIVNHILGAPNVTFIEAAADLDGSGTISINDKVVLINDYILGSNTARRQVKRSNGINGLNDVDYLYIEDIQMEPGETREVEVLMQTERTDIKALQCDIYLPEGVEFVYEEEEGVRYYCNTGGRAARSHTVDARIQGDGALRIVESNDNNTPFKQNDKAVFTFTIKANKNMANGSYTIRMANTELSYGQAINPADRESKLIVGDTSERSADVNGDGVVDVADIASVIDCMAGSAAVDREKADVNGDNIVDVADIAAIIDKMAGK